MIKNIVFDIGAVLVEFAPGRILVEDGVDKKDIKEVLSQTVLCPLWRELDRGVLPREEVIQKMIDQVDPKFKALFTAFMQDPKPGVEQKFQSGLVRCVNSFDYSKDWLKGLKKRGYKIYLLTNYPDWLFDYHWENSFSFVESVDGMVVSAKEKLVKPQKEIYQCLLERYNLNADECVFIDDRPENVDGAVGCGMKGIQFKDFESASSELESLL